MMFCAFAKAASKACSWPGRTSSIACSRTLAFIARSGCRVAHGLYVVTVGVEDECAVIRRVIHRSHAGLAVVFTARRHCRGVERVHLGARVGGERDVRLVISRVARGEPELRTALAHTGETVELHDQCDSERCERPFVEAFRAFEVGYGD